jgi:hypothetical protein
MTEHPKSTLSLDSLVTRVDALVQSINDREQIVSSTKKQIDDFQQRTEKLVGDKIADIEAKLNKSLSDELQSTVEYTKDLYSRFERMIWIAMGLLAAVSAFIGYQTFSSIPEKIDSEIGKIATLHKPKIDAAFDNVESTVKARNEALKKADDDLTAKRNVFQLELEKTVQDSTKGAAEKVGQITGNYENQLREVHTDYLIRVLQRNSDDADIVSYLVQAFPLANPTQQSRILRTLIGRDVPQNLVPNFVSSLESWKPLNAADGLPRYQVLVRYRSLRARDELQEAMKKAVSSGDETEIVKLVQTVWQVFSGGSPLSTGEDAAESPL